MDHLQTVCLPIHEKVFDVMYPVPDHVTPQKIIKRATSTTWNKIQLAAAPHHKRYL